MLWETPYGRSWTGSYIDSRSTPTYEEGKLYIVSGTGQINCIDAETGQTVWQIHAIKTYNGELFKYGESECLLLTETAVLYTTGGSQNTMVALNKKDGSLLWKAKSEGGPKAYASPTLINHNGRDIILTLTAKNIIGINPYNGEVLWSYDVMQYHKPTHGYGENTNPPLYNDGQVFITSGYNHPGVMLSLSEDGNEVQLKWMNEDFDTHHGGNLLLDGHIYGSNFQNNSNGKWMCANWKTGHTNWESEWETKGSIITADGMLYLYEEKRGNVALVEPSPQGLKVISTFQITSGDGPHWAHPAIYDGKLFIRHGDVLMVYDLTNEI
jgi:outer membrane protein assembly factor BamB